MITLDKVTKRFNETNAVNNLTVKIPEGQVVGFLGPNGAGKTTTMRMIVNIFAPTSGEIKIDGTDVSEASSTLKKKIGYLPENNPLYEEMLVSEYLDFIADMRELKDKKAALNQVVKETGIKDVFYKPIGELSKGYRQRVGLAQAIIHQPKILILDEPTEGLDPNQRVEIRGLIRSLGTKRTVILSTHVLQEVSQTCDRAIIINEGKLVADGSIGELTSGARKAKKITVEIEGKGISEKLRNIADIKSEQSAGQGRKKFVLSLSSKTEARPQIFELCKNEGWVLWELHQEETSLEDVFRELTL
ncbi:MAG: ATP-binding cassette domain-containing protein [Actinobacteria bacterium]|nr:MAG: ATP-binding cassette domain-containing protein [Actinomycetota bacterium]